MTLDELRPMFEDMGMQHIAKFRDLIKDYESFDLIRIGEWLTDRGLTNGVDYMIDYVDEPNGNNEYSIVPVVAFRDSQTAMVFKLTHG